MLNYDNLFVFFCVFYPLAFSSYLGLKKEVNEETYSKYLIIFFKRFIVGNMFYIFVTTNVGLNASKYDYHEYFFYNIPWLLFLSFIIIMIVIKDDIGKETVFFISLCQMANMGAYFRVDGAFSNVAFLFEETILFLLTSNIVKLKTLIIK